MSSGIQPSPDKPKLKPCPLCGLAPRGPSKSTDSSERNGYNFRMTIKCICGLEIARYSVHDKNGWCNDKGEAEAAVTKAWNQRVTSNG